MVRAEGFPSGLVEPQQKSKTPRQARGDKRKIYKQKTITTKRSFIQLASQQQLQSQQLLLSL
jgi:hypothetical protein